ncbi:MAG TPA: PilZ domain-containing protein, partial [Myxococcota bacterium]|nr:PilZ domain-containing protein [Myxococcota bacterium]
MERERRDSSRIRVGQPRVRVLEPVVWADAHVVELSASGVGLALPAGRWPAFARVRLRLGLPDAGEVELEAEPIRAAPASGGLLVGLRFCEIGPEALGRLSVFLVERFRREGQARDLGAEARERSLGVSRRDLVFRMLSHHLIGQGRPLRALRGQLELPGSLTPRVFDTVFGRMVVEGLARDGLEETLREGEELTFFFPSYQAIAFFEASLAERKFLSEGATHYGLSLAALRANEIARAAGELAAAVRL